MHHSFGDSNNNELPHITGPFWSSIDRLIITRPNETPPPLKEIFPEDIDSRKYRRKGVNIDGSNKVGNYRSNITEDKGGDEDVNDDDRGYDDEVDLDCIYSFSFKTTKIDLELWQIANIPFLKPMNLTTFWGNADLRLVAYSIPYSNKTSASSRDSSSRRSGSNRNKNFKEKDFNSITRIEPKIHSQDNIDYIFAVEIQHIYNHPDIIDDIDILRSDIESKNSSINSSPPILPIMIRKSQLDYNHPDCDVNKSSSEHDNNNSDNDDAAAAADDDDGDDDDDDDGDDSDDYFDALEGDDLYTFDHTVNIRFDNDAIINDNYHQYHNDYVLPDKSDIDNTNESFIDIPTVSLVDTPSTSISYRDTTPNIRSLTDTSPMYNSSSCLPRISTFKRHSYDSLEKQKTNNIISTTPMAVTTFKDAQFFKKSLVIAAIEVESLLSSSTEFNKRRVLYAFRIPLHMSSLLSSSSSSSSTKSNKYVLRSYGEWSQSSLPLLKMDDILNNNHHYNSSNNNNNSSNNNNSNSNSNIDNKLLLSKVKDINKRRIRLACSYDYAMKSYNNNNNNNNNDENNNNNNYNMLHLELFFSDLYHNQQFLVKYNNNHNNDRSSKKNNFNFTNKSSLSSSSSTLLLASSSFSSSSSSSYFKEGNVVVQKSNYFWCECHLGKN